MTDSLSVPSEVRFSRRRLLIGTGVLAATMAVPGLARAALPAEDVRRIETYLNELTTLEARFTQINPNGSTSSGLLFMRRPDAMRLQYDRPSQVLMIASEGRLNYSDPTMNQQTSIAVEDTPLSILLRPRIDLDDGVQVTDVLRQGGDIQIRVVPTSAKVQGSLTLVFADSPLELRRWAVVDAQGLVTQVMLEEVQAGVALDEQIFTFRNPRIWGPNANALP